MWTLNRNVAGSGGTARPSPFRHCSAGSDRPSMDHAEVAPGQSEATAAAAGCWISDAAASTAVAVLF